MEEHLHASAAFVDDHARLEKYVREHGREVERRMLQAHLDLRAARERPVDVHGADGVRRTTHRQWTRRLLTIVGMVEVKRRAYEAEGVDTLFPADAALNLPDDLYSFGVRRLVAEEACKISFDGVVEQTNKTLGVAVPKRQVEELTVRAARDFTAFYATRAVAAENTTALLVFGFNGKGVVMRHADLREGTKKAAERERSTSSRRGSPVVKNATASAWHRWLRCTRSSRGCVRRWTSCTTSGARATWRRGDRALSTSACGRASKRIRSR
jgi:hypothetical protein